MTAVARFKHVCPAKDFPGGSVVKDLPVNAGDTRVAGWIPGSGRSPAAGNGNPLQYSCLENPHGQRSLVGYSPWGHKESDTTEQLSAEYIQLHELTVLNLFLILITVCST